jgi:DNA-binding transcriptional LysR family regulator
MKGIELRQLRYFSIAARELHFRKAADLAFVTQPALSQQIAKLEEVVGVPLFTRDHRKVELTAAGIVLRDEVDKLFGQFDRALRLAREAGGGCEFCLSLGMIEYTNLSFIPPALIRLQAIYPAVRILRHEMSSLLQGEALKQHTIDVGFGAPLSMPQPDAGLRAAPLLQSDWALLMRDDHPLAARAELHLADLAGIPLIMFERGVNATLYDMIMDSCRDRGFSPHYVYETAQSQVGISLTSQGLGLMLGLSYIYTALPPGLVYRSIADLAPMTVHVFSRDDEKSQLIRDFIDLAAQEARRAQVELDDRQARPLCSTVH